MHSILNKIKKICKSIFKFFIPLRNTILLESHPNFSDSMICIYNEFIKRGVNQKYKLVWYTENGVKSKEFACANSKLKRFYYLNSAKYIVSSNKILYKSKKKQKTFYIAHGNPAKCVHGYYFFKEVIDYFICFSKKLEVVNSIEMHQPLNQTYGLGLPRNDKLFEKTDLAKYFGDYSRFIFWYPTVKSFKSGQIAGNGEGMPFLANENDIKKINKCAFENDVCLIVKMHFANKKIEVKNYSNIKIVDNRFYEDLKIHHYSFLGSGDALITDYSSIFYDFLHVNKPICLIWNDVNEYRKNPGLVEEFDKRDSKCADIVTNVDGLLNFIEKIGKNVDNKLLDREKIIDFCVNKYNLSITDSVCDFILDKIGYKKV